MKCTYVENNNVFEKTLNNFKRVGRVFAADFLSNLLKDHWATVYFEGTCYDKICSNVAKSLIAWIIDIRFLPVIACIDKVREKLIVQMY